MINSQLIKTAFFTNKYDDWDPNEGPFFINKKKYKIITMEQVHGHNISTVRSFKDIYRSDGVYTEKNGKILCVKTADCIPILISTEKGIGAIHAGWRGLSKNILDEFFNKIEYSTEDTKVTIGPHARKCCYEVTEEMIDIFPNYTFTNNSGYYLDMTLLVIDYLNSKKIEFEDTKVCTICDSDYYSYRRNQTSNRQHSFICL